MSNYVRPFRNEKTFAKCQLLYYETGCNVIIKVILWLTGGENELKERLKANKQTKKKSKEYVDGTKELAEYDLTFLYEISQNVCDLNGSNIHKQGELEYFLKKLKDGRNELAHPNIKQKNITDNDVAMKVQEMKDLSTKLLEKAGEKGNVSNNDIKNEIDWNHKNLERIKNDENIDKSMKPHVRNLILNDLKKIYIDDLESDFLNKLKEYSIPYLTQKKENKYEISQSYPLLTDIRYNSQVTIVVGDAGAGKTALTRFLFLSWLTGRTESFKEISEFDIVLRLQCNNIRSTDLFQFLEDHFPIAAYSFSNTSTLSRHFKDYKVFWIMDGYDESTPEFRGFLEAVQKYLPPTHKVLITTRLNTYESLIKCLLDLEVVTLYLGNLLDCNINEIIKNRINDEELHKSFLIGYAFLNDEEKSLLKTPIILILYIDLWQEDPNLVVKPITLIKLLMESTKQQLRILEQKHHCQRAFASDDDLKLSIENWFHGSLCKLSFLKVLAGKFNIDVNEVENLKKEATKGYLIASICTSSFLKIELADSNYYFKHASQQYYYAALFMKKLKNYSEFDIKKYAPKNVTFGIIELIEYYIQMIIEDDAINCNSEESFYPIREVISTFDECDQSYLWYETLASSNFNENSKQFVSQMLENCLFLDCRSILRNSSKMNFILEYVSPKKIVINTEVNYEVEIYTHHNMNYYLGNLLDYLYQLKYGNIQIELIPRVPEKQEETIKSQITNRYMNSKHQFFFHEIVANVIIRTLRWLYAGEEALEKHLVDWSDFSDFSSRDIYLLKKLAKENYKIEYLDPALLLKMAKIIFEVDSESNLSWTKFWRTFPQEKIELDKLMQNFNVINNNLKMDIKENRLDVEENNFLTRCDDVLIVQLYTEVMAHNIAYSFLAEQDQLKKSRTNHQSAIMTDETNNVISEQLKKAEQNSVVATIKANINEANSIVTIEFDSEMLTSFLSKAGQRGNVDSLQINKTIEDVQLNLKNLSSMKHFDILKTLHAKNIIIKELITQFENQNPYYEKEMESCVEVALLDADDIKKKISLSDISFANFQIIYVKGNSGMGKSVITRYLFTSWARGDMESLTWLRSFDIVLRVDCKGLQCCNSVMDLLERVLPESCNIFPTTRLLKEHLAKLNVAWICDGVDWEQFERLFYPIAKMFSKQHKFFITSRFFYSHMHTGYFFGCNISVKCYVIDLVSREKFDKLLSTRICNNDDRNMVISLHDSCDWLQNLLKNPFYLSTFIELWLNYHNALLESHSKFQFTETSLLVNLVNLQLHRLRESYCISDSQELSKKIDNWFYGSLCRQIFLMIYRHEFIIQRKVQNILEEDAKKENLDPIRCLEFFLEPITQIGLDGGRYSFINMMQPYTLASFYLRKWKDYPHFLAADIQRGTLETTVLIMNSYMIMAIHGDVNKEDAIETASKISSAFELNDKYCLWYNISVTNKFHENVMNFVSNFLDGCDCYTVPYVGMEISAIAKFLKFFTPKTVRFTYICIDHDYLDLLNMLNIRQTEILIGQLIPRSNLPHPMSNLHSDKFLNLTNEIMTLNVTFFEGTVKELHLLGNHLHKLRKIKLWVGCVGSYHKLCKVLPDMGQLTEITLTVAGFLSLEGKYSEEFLTRTTVICIDPSSFCEFIKGIQSIRGATTLKFNRLLIKNCFSSKNGDPDGVERNPYRDIVHYFQSVIDNLFSDMEFDADFQT